MLILYLKIVYDRFFHVVNSLGIHNYSARQRCTTFKDKDKDIDKGNVVPML